MAKIVEGELVLEPVKRERFAILITGGDTNQDGLADLTVEIAADPPGPMDTHMGPFTKNLPVKELISVAHAGMTMAHLPGVAQASVDQVIAILRAASRVP